MGGGNGAGWSDESLVNMRHMRRTPGPKGAHRPVPAPVLAQYRTITRPCDRCRCPLWPHEDYCKACCVEFGACVGLLDALQVAA